MKLPEGYGMMVYDPSREHFTFQVGADCIRTDTEVPCETMETQLGPVRIAKIGDIREHQK